MPSQNKMHKDEIEINTEIIKRLLSEQFPQYADLLLQKVKSTGTVNAIYRLGDDYCVRLPRLHWASKSLECEWKTLPIISKYVAITVPKIVQTGKPNAEYPLNWAIYKWIPGRTHDNSLVSETEVMKGLAQFIHELRAIPIQYDAPKAGRKPLRELNEVTVEAIKACKSDIDGVKVLKVWRELLYTEPWDSNPIWIHADLLKPNLIIYDGKPFAIIDFGSAGIGDPAFDIISAWTVLTSKTRELFRNLLCVDDSTWHRAKAYALHQAALIIPYYRESNPLFVNQAKDTISSILAV